MFSLFVFFVRLSLLLFEIFFFRIEFKTPLLLLVSGTHTHTVGGEYLELRYGYHMSAAEKCLNANDLMIHVRYLYQPMTSKSNIRAMQLFDAATSTFDANHSCGTEYPNNLYYTSLALLQLTSLKLGKFVRSFTQLIK